MDDIPGPGKSPNAESVRRIKGWVRDAGRLDDTATIFVSELHSHEPGCPDVETVIAVMRPGAGRLQVKFDKPISGLTLAAVERRFAT